MTWETCVLRTAVSKVREKEKTCMKRSSRAVPETKVPGHQRQKEMLGPCGAKANLPVDGETSRALLSPNDSGRGRIQSCVALVNESPFGPDFCLAEIREHGDLSLSSPLSH